MSTDSTGFPAQEFEKCRGQQKCTCCHSGHSGQTYHRNFIRYASPDFFLRWCSVVLINIKTLIAVSCLIFIYCVYYLLFNHCFLTAKTPNFP
jgi:hypothetical protein